MTKSPENLHKFYNENSHFLHSDLTHPSGVTATGPDAIRSSINELNLKYTKVDLTNGYVDAQKSANNGVFVLVVGTLAPPDAPDKPFVQTFLLSNQGSSSYYVSNSVFRLLVPSEEAEVVDGGVLVQLTPTAASVAPAAVVETPAAPVAVVPATKSVEDAISTAAVAASTTAAATAAESSAAGHIEAVEALLQEPAELEALATEPAPAATAPAAAAAPIAAPADPNRKWNYSDIVKKINSGASPAAAPVQQTRAPAPTHKVVPTAPAPAPTPVVYSVYVKQVPEAATAADLTALFSQFGVVTAVDMVSARSFAFVKYDSPAAITAAVAAGAAGKLTVHGQSLRVEERNPTRTAATSSSGATSGSGRDRDGASGRNRERNGRDGRDNGKERGGDRERGDRNRSSGGGEGKAGSGGRGGGSKSSGGAAGKTN
eukprot:CAMPEP_0170389832 /NCGR_PEP_ID=MMETSP0117_2-20130122/18824_1 /TAXON_ID=400756 /ORGANISM="Durinskia baltica, Strain CSIRO CS-38" /LENGTH=429 /DNA_ID=CAMNT_0010645839 /DNA_START=174 /DNA_END=1463 /DNA_ORIENTATION=-